MKKMYWNEKIKNMDNMEANVIRVTGRGAIHVVPDVTRLDLKLVSLHDTYDDAYAQAKSNTEKLAKIMTEVGLPVTLPKTIRLDIEKRTETEYDKFGHKSGVKFLGFELYHNVKIDIMIDNVLLNNIVKRVGSRLKQAEIEIGYTVKDPRPARLKMLERAVKDAKEKAGIMAAACGCSLGAVKNINYSFSEVHMYSQARQIHDAADASACNPESLDITPDDWAVSDDVTVEWYLDGECGSAETESYNRV